MPIGYRDLGFRAVDLGFLECDRKTDGGVLDLVVVRVIVNVAQVIIDVRAQVVSECLGNSGFVVVALGRQDRQAQEIRVDGGHFKRTGEQDVFTRRGLKHAVVGEVGDQSDCRKVA